METGTISAKDYVALWRGLPPAWRVEMAQRYMSPRTPAFEWITRRALWFWVDEM